MKLIQIYFKLFSFYSPLYSLLWPSDYIRNATNRQRKHVNRHKIWIKALRRVIKGSIFRFSRSGVPFLKVFQSYFKPFSFYSPLNLLTWPSDYIRNPTNRHEIKSEVHMRVIEGPISMFLMVKGFIYEVNLVIYQTIFIL